MFEYLLVTFMAIFVIVNPLTTAFIFMALLPRATKERRREIALRSTKIATSLFFVFATLGGIIFQLFGITLAAFRIAGGLILFGIAMNMIRAQQVSDEEKAEEAKSGKGQFGDDISVIPLAIPFMSGPGSIATVMILTSEAPTGWHVGAVYLAVATTMVICYFAMIHSRYIVEWLGETGKQILTKIFGLILAVLSIQFVINGVSDVVSTYLVQHGLIDGSHMPPGSDLVN